MFYQRISFQEKTSHSSVILLDNYGPSKNVKKSKGYLPILPAPGAFSVHTSIDKKMHRRKRKVISHGLGDDALADKNSHDDNWTLSKNMTDMCKI